MSLSATFIYVITVVPIFSKSRETGTVASAVFSPGRAVVTLNVKVYRSVHYLRSCFYLKLSDFSVIHFT